MLSQIPRRSYHHWRRLLWKPDKKRWKVLFHGLASVDCCIESPSWKELFFCVASSVGSFVSRSRVRVFVVESLSLSASSRCTEHTPAIPHAITRSIYTSFIRLEFHSPSPGIGTLGLWTIFTRVQEKGKHQGGERFMYTITTERWVRIKEFVWFSFFGLLFDDLSNRLSCSFNVMFLWL